MPPSSEGRLLSQLYAGYLQHSATRAEVAKKITRTMGELRRIDMALVVEYNILTKKLNHLDEKIREAEGQNTENKD